MKKILKKIGIIAGILIVLFISFLLLIIPLIDEYYAKGNAEPLYVEKGYIIKKKRTLYNYLNKNEVVPETLQKKFSLNNIYIYPLFSYSGYGEMYNKSVSSPYHFEIFMRGSRGYKNNIVIIKNLIVRENFYLFRKKIYEYSEEKKGILTTSSIGTNYGVELIDYTDDLKVSKYYMKPLIVTFDASTEVNGKMVTKSFKYVMKPEVIRGVNWPNWFYQI